MYLFIIKLIFLLEILILIINGIRYKVINKISALKIVEYLTTSRSQWGNKKLFQQRRDENQKINMEFKRKACPLDIDLQKYKGNKSLPNIILAVFDDRRLDDFSLKSKTPNSTHDTPFLEEFQNESILFNNVISQGCWTKPSHASMFTGFRANTLQNDLNQPFFNIFPDTCFSIAELLTTLGYDTISIADHPDFLPYMPNNKNSFIRGFKYFDTIGRYPDLRSWTNIGTKNGKIDIRSNIESNEYHFTSVTIKKIIEFNQGETNNDFDLMGDYDKLEGLYYPKIEEFYERSPFFQQRYINNFKQLFSEDTSNPFFLFLNLHFCDLAVPDNRLLSEWKLEFLLMNAKKNCKKLNVPKLNQNFDEYFNENLKNVTNLEPWRIKHHFDTRFYDFTFKKIIDYFENNGLLKNSIIIITSDHGFGFSEHKEERYLHGGARPYGYLVEVPLLIRFPENNDFNDLHGIYPNRISSIDIFYTIMHVALGRDISNSKVFVYEHRKSDDLSLASDYVKSHEVNETPGKSIISRILENDFEDAIITESNVLPHYYDIEPYTKGKMIGVYYKNYKWMYANNLRADYQFSINPKNLKSIISKDNLKKLLLLLNPKNIFCSPSREFDMLFNLKNDENSIIDNAEIKSICKKMYEKYDRGNKIIEDSLYEFHEHNWKGPQHR